MRNSLRPNLRAYFIVASVLVVLVLVGSLVRFPALPQPAPKVVPSPLRTIPHTDVNPIGANFFLQWEAEPWKVEKTLEMAKEVGIGWVKQQFPWEELEPKKGRFVDERTGASTWEKYDRIVSLAEKYGLSIIARLDRPPAWTRTDNRFPEAPPDNFSDYGRFVAAVVEHYRGKIRYYQLWNEPNIWPEWGDRPIEAASYVQLLRIGYQAAKQADPNVFILSAPLAQTVERSPTAMSDLEYLEAMYQAGAKDYFDILFANAYGFSLPPEDPPSPDRLNFRRVELLRQIMVKYGDADKPAWFNEFGWNAAPDHFPPDKLLWGRVSEEEQAQYILSAIQRARQEWPWAGVFCIWYFRQAGHVPSDSAEYYFRMVDVGFTPRLVYQAVKEGRAGKSPATAGDYQETNLVLTSEGSWQLKADPKASGKLILMSNRPGDSLTVSFYGTEIWLVVLKDSRAGSATVTIDGKEANRLPRDRQGRSYLDLYSPETLWQARVLVATGLPYGKHSLRLAVSAPRHPGAEDSWAAIDGFAVRMERGIPTFYWLMGGLVVGILVLWVAGWWWLRRRARG